MQTSAAQNVTDSVPARSGRTPKLDGSKSGAQVVPVRKSQGETSAKNSSAGTSRATRIPRVVSTETSAKSASTTRTTSSP